MAEKNKTSSSFEEMKTCFTQRLIKEGRCFCITDNESKNTFRIEVSAVNPHSPCRSCWQPGIIRKAYEDVVKRMNISCF